jgi:serine/threonine protein kinase
MIDRYEILRKLATGGMAELFLAKQSGLEGFEKVVVIKRILSHLAQDEEFVTMFLDEARIAAKLSHPNIVQIYDLGKADDSYYIAMEYVSGRNVQHILNKQEEKGSLMPIEHACRILAGVCDGLHYAHSRKDYDGQPLNIVHRDISPQNILVSFAGGVKVVDFGIAKASTQLAQTRAGVLKGKYAYMSPEQVRGQPIDHRSDIFAVGLVMYESLTGRRAFERDSSLKTLKAIVQEKPLNPRELNPDIPLEVVKLLSKALEKSPDRRYKNAQEMQLAIEDYLESSPRKSNNVRLSRYLYELFDDELNSESGTMVVQGIGEVIIPTGANKEAKPKVSVEEDVDSKTLSAALAPSPPKSAAEEEDEDSPRLGRRRPSEPGVRVVRDDQASGHMEQAPAGDAYEEEEEATNVNAEPPAPPPGYEASVDADAESEEEPEDKTIPVYDIEAYERERERRAASDAGGPVAEPPGALSASIPNDQLLGPDDATAAAIDAREISGRRRQPDAHDKRAAELLAKVEAMAEGAADDGSTIPPPSAGTEDEDPDWEDPTQNAPPTSPLMDGQLHSTEAVIGSGGPVAVAGSGSGEIRPAAAASGDIRPAARPNARGHANANLKEVTRPPVEPPPSDRTVPSQPVRALQTPSAPLDSPTPTTGRSPAAQIGHAPQKAGVPPLVYAMIAAMVVFFLTAVGAVVALVVVGGSDDGGKAGASRLLTIETNPPGLPLGYDGTTQTSPASFIVKQGDTVTVEVEFEGRRYESPIAISLGTTPLVRKIDMIKQKESEQGGGAAGGG